MRKIETAEERNKVIWEVIKRQTRNEQKKSNLTIYKNDLNRFFSDVGRNTAISCADVGTNPMQFINRTNKKPKNSIFMQEESEQEILEIIRGLKNKSTKDTYEITCVLKGIAPSVAGPLSQIFTRCLSVG